jgi:hypothetical protein
LLDERGEIVATLDGRGEAADWENMLKRLSSG